MIFNLQLKGAYAELILVAWKKDFFDKKDMWLTPIILKVYTRQFVGLK